MLIYNIFLAIHINFIAQNKDPLPKDIFIYSTKITKIILRITMRKWEQSIGDGASTLDLKLMDSVIQSDK